MPLSPSSLVYSIRTRVRASSLAEGDFRIRPKLLILAIANREPDALRAVAEVQGIVAIRGNRKPKAAFDFRANRGEVREEVLGLRRSDLGNGLAFTADDGEIPLINPEQAVEKP